MRQDINRASDALNIRQRTVEHLFGALKARMGHAHFLTEGIEKVKTEISLNVMARNLKRMIAILGVRPLIASICG